MYAGAIQAQETDFLNEQAFLLRSASFWRHFATLCIALGPTCSVPLRSGVNLLHSASIWGPYAASYLDFAAVCYFLPLSGVNLLRLASILLQFAAFCIGLGLLL